MSGQCGYFGKVFGGRRQGTFIRSTGLDEQQDFPEALRFSQTLSGGLRLSLGVRDFMPFPLMV